MTLRGVSRQASNVREASARLRILIPLKNRCKVINVSAAVYGLIAIA